jgi:hypothetical protein
MKPALLARGDRGDGVERIDGAGVGRAGRGDDEPRPEAARAVGGDRVRERIGPHPEALVDGHMPHLRLGHPGEA